MEHDTRGMVPNHSGGVRGHRNRLRDILWSRAAGRLPNVYVIGAAKCGTSALYEYFRVHPHVFVPETLKETNYMAFYRGLPPLVGPGDREHVGGSILKLSDYRRLYRAWSSEPVAADVSPSYLYYPRSPAMIARLAPTAKIVIVLRNPVDCAFSMYAMMRRDGREPCRSFREAFTRSSQRLADGWEWAWDYQGCFKFAAQVTRYLERFPKSQIFVGRYEQMRRDPLGFYRELTRFLDIPMIDLDAANRCVNRSPRRIDMLSRRKAGRLAHRAARMAATLCPSARNGPRAALVRAARPCVGSHRPAHAGRSLRRRYRCALADPQVGPERLAARVGAANARVRTDQLQVPSAATRRPTSRL